MSCAGHRGDYRCPAWQARARMIRRRDHNRCRDCGRKSKLEVHHLYYSRARGACGHCVLLGVSDAALIALCADCHDKRHGRGQIRRPGWFSRLLNRLFQ